MNSYMVSLELYSTELSLFELCALAGVVKTDESYDKLRVTRSGTPAGVSAWRRFSDADDDSELNVHIDNVLADITEITNSIAAHAHVNLVLSIGITTDQCSTSISIEGRQLAKVQDLVSLDRLSIEVCYYATTF